MSKKSNNIMDKNTLETNEKLDDNIVIDDEFPELDKIKIEADTNYSIQNSNCAYIIAILVMLVILIIIFVFSTVFALLNKNDDTIINGVMINNIDVSGLSYEQAIEKVSLQLAEELNTSLSLVYEDYENTLLPIQDIDAIYDVASAVDMAYLVGHSNNIFKNNFEILFTYISKKKIVANLQYSEEKLSLIVSNISFEIPGLVKQSSYYIEDSNLIIVNGETGVKLLQNETKELIIEAVKNISRSNTVFLLTETVEPDEIDINKIYEEVHTEPQNAYIIENPFELNLGSSGTDFAITLEEANNLLLEDKDEYVIPLKITEADITVADLGDSLFSDTLGNYSSRYNVSNYNRSNNVELATEKINGTIILPGQEFSYNKIVGERTIASGFKEASVYTSNGIENGLGGGICQVSSTLYNAVLDANLEIVERKNHRYTVTYVPLGKDATVAYGSIDFRFKNNRNYPIKVVAYSSNGVCNISITGIKEEVEYDVNITTKKLQTFPFETKYINDSSLYVGTQVVSQSGDYGYKYETYMTLSLNGSIISTTLISTDTYTPLPRIIKVGTKQ